MEEVKYKGLACYNSTVMLDKSVEFSKKNKLLVLETNSYPDYYSIEHFPPNNHQKDWRLFLLVENHINCFQDMVLKEAYKIKRKFSDVIDIKPGQLDFKGNKYLCVRLFIKNSDVISPIVSILQNMGLSFAKDTSVEKYESLHYYKRYTELTKIIDGVYRDIIIPGYYYFSIDQNVEYEEFLIGIKKIKHSCNFHMFDSMLSFMFTDSNKGQDFIGIYSEHCDENRFAEMKILINNTFNKDNKIV